MYPTIAYQAVTMNGTYNLTFSSAPEHADELRTIARRTILTLQAKPGWSESSSTAYYVGYWGGRIFFTLVIAALAIWGIRRGLATPRQPPRSSV
jgi:hypothetical protein